MFIINNKRFYESFGKGLIVQFSILITFSLLLSGCGRKAPPVAPRQVKPPAVNDLSASIDGDMLKLTWTIPREKEKVTSGLSGFIVYRSKRLSSESDCKSCPVLFKRVTDIPIEVPSSGYIKRGNMIYVETMEKGYRYIYKVTFYAEGIISSDSNYVDFIY